MSTSSNQLIPYLPIFLIPILLSILVCQLRLKIIWKILLFIPVGGLAFLTYLFPLLPLMFAYGHYFMAPYAWLIMISLIGLIASNWVARRKEKANTFATFQLSLTALIWASIFFIQNNPSTLGRKVTIQLPQETLFYTGHEIIEHMTNLQKLMALDILRHYDGVNTIEFIDISENPHYQGVDGGEQFTATALVNQTEIIYFDFDSKTNETPETLDDYGNIMVLTPKDVPNKLVDKEVDYTTYPNLEELLAGHYDKQLAHVTITYYTKNDMYKNKK